jgi:hypothetical protein
LFLQNFKKGGETEGNNLAYMLRRSEVPPELEVPTIKELLSALLDKKDSLNPSLIRVCFKSEISCIKTHSYV